MPALSDLTYGRSAAGRKKVISEYQSWVNSYKKYLDGDQYNKIVSAVNNGWSGPDAHTFLVQLERIMVELRNRTDLYIDRMYNTLQLDDFRFSNQQDTNQKIIENTNTRF